MQHGNLVNPAIPVDLGSWLCRNYGWERGLLFCQQDEGAGEKAELDGPDKGYGDHENGHGSPFDIEISHRLSHIHVNGHSEIVV